MPKRSYPFKESVNRQNKIHVGNKEVNSGSQNLKFVYEKTLSMLFAGARNTQNNNVVEPMDIEERLVMPRDTKPHKQLLLMSNGTLGLSAQFLKQVPPVGENFQPTCHYYVPPSPSIGIDDNC